MCCLCLCARTCVCLLRMLFRCVRLCVLARVCMFVCMCACVQHEHTEKMCDRIQQVPGRRSPAVAAVRRDPRPQGWRGSPGWALRTPMPQSPVGPLSALPNAAGPHLHPHSAAGHRVHQRLPRWVPQRPLECHLQREGGDGNDTTGKRRRKFQPSFLESALHPDSHSCAE